MAAFVFLSFPLSLLQPLVLGYSSSNMNKKKFSHHLGSLFVDLLCTLSVVAIWPRFIEPRRLKTTKMNWRLPSSFAHLKGLRLVHITDLHFNKKISDRYLKKITRKIRRCKPDLIVFTGDFLCYSNLEQKERLRDFLSSFSAPLGCYCTFGNHDYASYVSRNSEGVYDVSKPINPALGLIKGLRVLLQKKEVKGMISKEAQSVTLHQDLCKLLESTPFKLLENTCLTLPIGLNIVGLGDYGLGRFRPETAFAGYASKYPGIVLSHNPDTISTLMKFPGDWILCGHTHGEQIHFPFPRFLREFSKKLTRLENTQYTRGLYQEGAKTIYVNRGLGCHKPLRFCSPPEMMATTFVIE